MLGLLALGVPSLLGSRLPVEWVLLRQVSHLPCAPPRHRHAPPHTPWAAPPPPEAWGQPHGQQIPNLSEERPPSGATGVSARLVGRRSKVRCSPSDPLRSWRGLGCLCLSPMLQPQAQRQVNSAHTFKPGVVTAPSTAHPRYCTFPLVFLNLAHPLIFIFLNITPQKYNNKPLPGYSI